MKDLQLMYPRRTCIIVIDPQERLMKAVEKPERVVGNTNLLMRTAEIFDIPVIATTQYKKGLGPIVSEIELPQKGLYFADKTEFNCFYNKDFQNIVNKLPASVDTMVLTGVEAHICVFQTALSSLRAGYNTWVATDAVSSRKKRNAKQAISLMQASSIWCAPTETIVYQLLKKAGTDQFKAMLKHLK